MQKTGEYLSRASECRELARSASPSRREELEHMSATYERLAEMRHLGARSRSSCKRGTQGQLGTAAAAPLETIWWRSTFCRLVGSDWPRVRKTVRLCPVRRRRPFGRSHLPRSRRRDGGRWHTPRRSLSALSSQHRA